VQCVTSKARLTGKCPYEGCQQTVPKDCERLKECEELLEFLFPPIGPSAADLQTEIPAGMDSSQQLVHVTTLTGDSRPFRFYDSMPVGQLKKEIEKQMEVKVAHQRLIFREKELEV